MPHRARTPDEQTGSQAGLSPITRVSLPAVARLYGFDTGLLQLEQLHVDEAHRGALGAVESTLCSLGTMSTFAP